MENIEEIDAQRINGWLDLDSYFIKRLGRPFEDQEDLENNGLIATDNRGVYSKFWILDEEGNKIALFKTQDFGSDEAYAELFSEEVAKILGMPAAHYDLAKFDREEGVISYNFIKEFDTYYPGFDVIAEFYENNLEGNEELNKLYGIDYYNDDLDKVTDKLNNLEDIWIILERKYKKHADRKYIVSKIMNGMVDKLIFDILMVNVDDHCDNWGIFDEIEEGRMASPQFDNSHVLNLQKNILTEHFVFDQTIEDKELRFTVDNTGAKKPLEVLKYFLDISSSEFTDLVRDKVNTLKEHVDEIPIIIETRTKQDMPDYLKEYFISTMHDHLDKVSDIVDSKSKGTK